ncbi:Homoserine dehydrogenase [Microbotryomycetes sp. JL201]|nr:Homoserine dehydrogenase [Microbotryomycetes sp. JL201]
MARPAPVTRDLAFLVLMAGAFALPALQQRQSTAARELVQSTLRACAIAGGAISVVVIGGGLVLAGERVYDRVVHWWSTSSPRKTSGGGADTGDAPPGDLPVSTKAAVAIVGVGLVGKQVVHQLSSPALRKLFDIVSLSNSKHTVSISPSASSVDAQTLLSLLPPSSAPLPESSTHPGTSYSSANPIELVKSLAVHARSTKTATILVDCTSDLSVTELYPTAIASGLSVVTPNKKGFSSSDVLWQQILDAQSAPGAGLVYLEATVGAGLPIISTLRDLLKTGDEINKIEGVFSGTLSYIFNEFSKPSSGNNAAAAPKFSEIVKVAKENGYTEPHPADDLSGSDVARKLTILSRLISANPSTKKALPSFPDGFASLSTDTLIPSALSNVASGEEFVAKLPEHDGDFDKLRSEAEAEGKVLRYVGVIDRESGVVKCALEKYPASHPFAASLSGSDNIVAFHTSRYSARPLIVQGSGAGADVTAMGVVADVIKVAERYGVRVHL